MEQRQGLQQLYAGNATVADVVFVHGLFGHPQATWTGVRSKSTAAHATPPSVDAATSNPRSPKRKSAWKIWQRENEHSKTKSSNSSTDVAQRARSLDLSENCQNQIREVDGLFWPKEILPDRIPETRIYTWGYDVDINHIFGNASQATTFQQAGSLLSDLANERVSAEAKCRPLIFVAHSLGGLIVKDMLCASRNEVTYLKDILPATYGIIFLGTPHRGSSIASLGKMAQETTKLLWKRPNVGVLRDLESSSQTLDRIGRGFSQILVETPIEIQSFREELPTKGIMVVDSYSSAIENGRELIGLIPADHEHMTKFSGSSDPGFVRVAATLARWVDNLKARAESDGLKILQRTRVDTDADFENKIELVRSWLKPVSFRPQLAAVLERRIQGSCDYIYTKEQTIHWLEERERISCHVLSIHGVTGSGKTTLAASILDLTAKRAEAGCRTAYAFCSQLSTIDVLRSLIWQISQDKSSVSYQKVQILDAYREYGASGTALRRPETQQILILRELLQQCLQPCHRVTLVLDGVDQCESPQQLMNHILVIAEGVLCAENQCKILITSRSQLQIAKLQRQPFKVNTLEIGSEDLKFGVTRFLRHSFQGLVPQLNNTKEAEIQQRLLDRVDDGWLDIMHTLAKEYLDLGRYNAAESLEQEVLEARKKINNPKSTSTLESLTTYAIAISEQGRWQEGEVLMREVVETWKSIRDPNDSNISTAMNDLSLTLMRGGKEQWQEAESLQMQLLERWDNTNDAGKLPVAMNQLANIYMDQDRLEEAEQMARRALTAVSRLSLPNSEKIIDYQGNLGQILSRRGRWKEAEELEIPVMESREKIHGKDHWKTLSSMGNVAWAFSEQGRHEEAKTMQLEVLERRTRVLGPNHHDTLGTAGVLAMTCHRLGQAEEARRYARLALGF